MKYSKILAIITGGILLADFILPTDMAMTVVLGTMGLTTIFTTIKEKI